MVLCLPTVSANGIHSKYSHIAWIRSIKEKVGVDIPLPATADLDMRVATLLGMIHPDPSATAAVRCVFFIGPEQKLRALIYYPLNVGRNMQEILRIVDALQTADKDSCALPANWHAGEAGIILAPTTQAEAEKRTQEGCECVDWFLCKKKL
jgi:peroxiredoxin (alkyl hydroperoxide reductase subunit C)